MKIDRHNYEEYFILYMDNELSAADRLMVEQFVEQHPDLKEELELLMQFRLPAEEIAFPDKSVLQRSELPVEEMLMLLDDELDPEKADVCRKKISLDESLNKEFTLLQATKLEPVLISFPDKASLYRKEEEKVRVFSFGWRRIAAAVILFLAAGAVFLLMNGRNSNDDQPEIVKSGSGDQTSPVVTPNDPQKSIEQQKEVETPQVSEIENSGKDIITAQSKVRELASTHTPVEKQIIKQVVSPENIPQQEVEAEVLAVTKPVHTPVSDPQYDFSNSVVTSVSPHPLNIRNASVTVSNIEGDDQEPVGGKKSKLRGLFRKVTRTIEKRTDIDATDEDGRLLVAGLAIKL